MRPRRLRHASLSGGAAIIAVTLSALGGCTSLDPVDTKKSDIVSYVQLLRGENDLAHSSLEIPVLTTLPAFASTAFAAEHAGQRVPRAAVDDLADLASRSGETPDWITLYLCQATSADKPTIEAVLARLAIQPASSDPASPITTINGAADFIARAQASLCLDQPVRATTAEIDALSEAAHGNALVSAQLASLTDSLELPRPQQLLTAEAIAEIDAAINADGCSEWVQANSVAAVFVVGEDAASRGILDCARSTTTEITEPLSLAHSVSAGMPSRQTAAIIDRNRAAVDRWLTPRWTIASPGSKPVGLGTAAATSDAALLLRIHGIENVPDWMTQGAREAVRTVDEAALSVNERAEIVHLCVSIEAGCESTFVAESRAALTASLPGILRGPGNDAERARIVEQSIGAGVEMPKDCGGLDPASLLEKSPQTFVAIAAEDKACFETLDLAHLSDESLLSSVRASIANDEPERALALCIIRELTGGFAPNAEEFRRAAREEFDRLWQRLEHPTSEAAAASASRPLRIELLKAEVDQWLK